MTAANLNITIDRAADWSKVITITDSGDDPVALTAAVAGVKQVETATTSGAVSAGGVVAVSFVSALTGTVSKLVTVTAGDTPTVTNAKICQSFNADPVFSAYFKATYSTGSLIATALAAAADDPTVNWSGAGSGTTATGVSAAAASATTTAGVAQVFGLASFKGQLSVRQGSPSIAEFRFEIISGGDGNQVRVVLPRNQTANLSPDQKYHFDWFADIGTSRARHIQGTASVRGSSTVFGTTLLPAQSSTPPPSASVAWGDITGTLSDQTDLQSALDGKLATAGTAADVNPAGTSIASALSGKAATSHTHVSADVTDATSTATPNTLVLRDGSGNTAIGNATGSVTGNAGTVTSIGNLTGVITSTNRATAIADGALSIAKTNGLQAALDGKAAASHTHVSADVTDATSTATPNTLVLRSATGGASFSGLALSGLNTNSGSYSQVGGANFNVATTTAANLTATGSGIVTVSGEGGTTISGGTLTFSPSGFTYGTSAAASAHRIALGAGTTGAELFGAATAAAAQATLGVTSKRKTVQTDRNNTGTGTTYTTDGDFTIPVEAGKTYRVEFAIYVTCTNNSQFKGQFVIPSLPSNFSAGVSGVGLLLNAAGVGQSMRLLTTGVVGDNAFPRTSAVSNGVFVGWFEVTIGTTGGNLLFQWAQNASSVDNTSVLANSCVTVRERFF